MVIPAVSGPYDLGNVTIRAAVYVDPVTAEVTTVSDPLPQIVEGVPLRTRSILVSLDRPGFTLNPTNCDRRSVTATVGGSEGGTANLSSHFQVANCSALDYQPGLKLSASGGFMRRGHPAIHAEFTARQGEANTSRVTVTLPKGEQLDNSHIETVCTRVAFAADSCPQGSAIGWAEVTTPLLDAPLSRPCVPALVEPQASGSGRGPEGPDRRRAVGEDRQRQRPPPGLLHERARCAGDQPLAPPDGRKAGPGRQQHRSVQDVQEIEREAQEPERRGPEAAAEGSGPLRDRGDAQAPPAPPRRSRGGAVDEPDGKETVERDHD